MRYILITIFFLIFNQSISYATERGIYPPQKDIPVDGIRIAWDYSSMQQIDETGGYPRLLRMQDKSVIAIYENRRGAIYYKRSYDEGSTWTEAREVFSQFSYSNLRGESTVVNMSNPEIIQLKNGDILIACNYRPAKAEIAPYSIVIRRSTDNGKSWTAPQTLYTAAPRFIDGCWEPSFLELPTGELQVYFANENPYQQSDEQEISVVSSSDNGITWAKEAKTVSFRKKRRDGMPVARIVGDEIVVIIEDNNIDRFKPYTVRTKISENWYKPVLADSPNREYTLAEKIADSAYLGAPYFLVLPTGETVISYQTNENRDKDWELSTMEVAIGDRSARNFNRRTQPFDVPLNKEAKWNSLAMWDDTTIVAFASSNFRSKLVAPWLIKGYIIPELKAEQKNISRHPIFIGAKGETNLRAGIGADNENLYIECKVNDKSGEVYLYFHTGKEAYKIWSAHTGELKMWKKKDDLWQSISADKVKITPSVNSKGYLLSFAIPKKIISIRKQNNIRFNMALSTYDNSQTGDTELIVSSHEDLPHTWLKVEL